jgi:carbon monoxide dehydrogenase subunit G
MQFSGEKQFPMPPKEVFARLSDARFLLECIPGRESTTHADEHMAVFTQRPGFAFVRGTLEATIKILEATPDSTIRYSLLSKGIGSTSEVESVLQLAANEGGTQVRWTAEVKNLGGLLKAVPRGLIQGAAQKVILDAWQEIEKRLQ